MPKKCKLETNYSDFLEHVSWHKEFVRPSFETFLDILNISLNTRTNNFWLCTLVPPSFILLRQEILLDFIGLWRRCVAIRIIQFLDVVHRPMFKTQRSGKLDLFPSRGVRQGTSTLLGPLERASLSHVQGDTSVGSVTWFSLGLSNRPNRVRASLNHVQGTPLLDPGRDWV